MPQARLDAMEPYDVLVGNGSTFTSDGMPPKTEAAAQRNRDSACATSRDTCSFGGIDFSNCTL